MFGGAGWTGVELVARLVARGYDVAAPARAEADVAERAQVAAWTERVRPHVVFDLTGRHPGSSADEMERVNAHGARVVAEEAARVGARLVHVSTDVVLDGRAPPYADDAEQAPLNDYGRTKAAGERAALAVHPDAVAVRTSLIWDPRAVDRGTAGFAARLARGEPCPLFTDEIRCPVLRASLAEALVRLAEVEVRGTLNVAGDEALSRHAFGLLCLRHFGVAGVERVTATRAADLEAAGGALRPRDVTLDVSRAKHLLGLALPGPTRVLAAWPATPHP